MGVNKVELKTGEVLIDLSKDTVTEETLPDGVTAHDAHGKQITGKMKVSSDADTVDGLHAVVSETEATVDDKSVITFILGG